MLLHEYVCRCVYIIGIVSEADLAASVIIFQVLASLLMVEYVLHLYHNTVVMPPISITCRFLLASLSPQVLELALFLERIVQIVHEEWYGWLSV